MKILTLKNINKRKPIVLVGLGNMGKAMLTGWCLNGLSPEAIRIVSPNSIDCINQFPGLNQTVFLDTIFDLEPDLTPSAVILAVKPQIMETILPSCVRFLNCNPLYLSIAAGKSLNFFAHHLGGTAKIVRAMPNTPASIGLGMTAAVANNHVTDDQKELCVNLMESMGAFEWLGDEGLMDAVTAVSGSGPAYIFLLAESMTEAAIKQGIPPEIARKLAYQTVIGAAALLGAEMVKNIDPQKPTATRLRENVTSPNGTTAAALSILMAPNAGMPQLMNNAIQLATDRSRELNGPTSPQGRKSEGGAPKSPTSPPSEDQSKL